MNRILEMLMIVLLLIGFGYPVRAQSNQFDLFSSDEPLLVRIDTDMKNLLKMTKEDEYQKAQLTIGDETIKIRIRPRGNNRLENCSFPPITLNFKKAEFRDSSFNQLRKIKLVNACKLQLHYEQFLLREFLIYRSFNLLSEYSFKVRLLRLEYVDSRGKMKPVERFGFVIEDIKMLANRKTGMEIKALGLKDEVTNRDQMVLISLFQYMVGNTDWQVAALQNLKLIKLLDFNEPAPYVIPYDFDYTGMVNAPYAIPSDNLAIDNITERLYWGQCYTETELEAVIKIFLARKEEIYTLYKNFSYLDKQSQVHSINYLDSFYKIIENKKSWKNTFMSKCD